jgi:hypothetical protein
MFNSVHWMCHQVLINLTFLQDISESQILAAATQFVSLGLKDVGYEYVNIDVSLWFH